MSDSGEPSLPSDLPTPLAADALGVVARVAEALPARRRLPRSARPLRPLRPLPQPLATPPAPLVALCVRARPRRELLLPVLPPLGGRYRAKGETRKPVDVDMDISQRRTPSLVKSRLRGRGGRSQMSLVFRYPVEAVAVASGLCYLPSCSRMRAQRPLVQAMRPSSRTERNSRMATHSL